MDDPHAGWSVAGLTFSPRALAGKGVVVSGLVAPPFKYAADPPVAAVSLIDSASQALRRAFI